MWIFGLAVIFQIDEALVKGFLTCQNKCWNLFFRPTPENFDNPEKFVFSGLSEFSSAGRKKRIADLESRPQKTLKNEKYVFFYMCIK